jgi:hypothetical protein
MASEHETEVDYWRTLHDAKEARLATVGKFWSSSYPSTSSNDHHAFVLYYSTLEEACAAYVAIGGRLPDNGCQ